MLWKCWKMRSRWMRSNQQQRRQTLLGKKQSSLYLRYTLKISEDIWKELRNQTMPTTEVALVWGCWDASHLHFLPDMFCIAHWQAFMTSKLSLLWMHFFKSTQWHKPFQISKHKPLQLNTQQFAQLLHKALRRHWHGHCAWIAGTSQQEPLRKSPDDYDVNNVNTRS